MAIKPGSPAPDFSLPASDGRTYTLSELRGQVIVLNFYPADSSMVCTKQMCQYSERIDDFGEAQAVILGISPQGLSSKERFARENELKIPLLADEGGEVAKAYGLGGLGGNRATFVIDQEGQVAWVYNSLTALRFASSAEILDQVEALV